MGMQRSTTDLAFHFAHLVAVHAQGAHGRVVDVGEQALLDTATKQQRGGRRRKDFPRRGSPFAALRSSQHPHGKPEPSPASESPRDPRRAEPTSKPVHDSTHLRRRQRPQRQARQPGDAASFRDSPPCGFEADAVLHARRTDGFTAAATETTIEVVGERRVRGGEVAALERAHQLDAAAGRIGFVSGGKKRGAGLQAEAAVHACIQPFKPSSSFFALPHSPSVATTSAAPGSNVRRSPVTSGPTPSR